MDVVKRQMELYESGGSGRIVFEIGAAAKGCIDARDDKVFEEFVTPRQKRAFQQAVELYED